MIDNAGLVPALSCLRSGDAAMRARQQRKNGRTHGAAITGNQPSVERTHACVPCAQMQ
ncbi:hypothetical protein [Xanthomonas arboricola]|uniref:hypothetical protein n=1 Tax=Xanthomonas arboricola TaxID=56448 RepID=UPI001559E717|nr:hypothetical protein [Xanthomonas arboricola]